MHYPYRSTANAYDLEKLSQETAKIERLKENNMNGEIDEEDIDVYAWIVDDPGKDGYTGHAWMGGACQEPEADCDDWRCPGVCHQTYCSWKTIIARGPSRGNSEVETAEVCCFSLLNLTLPCYLITEKNSIRLIPLFFK